MLNSFYSTVDDKQLTTLISLDISAAFDTISHGTLLKRLAIPKDPSWDHCCSSSTFHLSATSSRAMESVIINTLMIPNCSLQ